MNNYQIITIKDLSNFTEEYCVQLINKYKYFNFMIVNEDNFEKENKNIFSTIEFLTNNKNIEYHLLVVVKGIDMEKTIREFFPDFDMYPTVILFENGEIKEYLEGNYIVAKK